MSTKGESGLSRWARRKAAVRETQETAAPKRGAALPTAAAAAGAQAPATDAAPPDRSVDVTDQQGSEVPEPLPDIETLDYDSDYAGFLSKDVSDSVRNLALRKLWRSNPLLANVDGLVDYDDDFTDAATVIEGMKSVYRVGRGMVEDEPEGADEAVASSAPGSAEPQDAAQDEVAAAEPSDAAPTTESKMQTAAEESPDDAMAENTEAEKHGDAS